MLKVMAEGVNQAVAEQMPVLEFDAFKSLPDQHMMENYGLTNLEGQRQISFGSWSGTVAEMLSDPKCPMGARVRDAHFNDGIAGVTQVFEGFKMAGAETTLVVEPKTEEHYILVGAVTPEAKKKVLSKIWPRLHILWGSKAPNQNQLAPVPRSQLS